VYLQIGFWSCIAPQEFIATLGDQCFSSSRTKWPTQTIEEVVSRPGVAQSGECEPKIFADSRMIAQDANLITDTDDKQGHDILKMGLAVGCETRIIPPYPDN